MGKIKWEYKTLVRKDHEMFLPDAQVLGEDGWELLHIENVNGFTVGFFKRPKDDQ